MCSNSPRVFYFVDTALGLGGFQWAENIQFYVSTIISRLHLQHFSSLLILLILLVSIKKITDFIVAFHKFIPFHLVVVSPSAYPSFSSFSPYMLFLMCVCVYISVFACTCKYICICVLMYISLDSALERQCVILSISAPWSFLVSYPRSLFLFCHPPLLLPPLGFFHLHLFSRWPMAVHPHCLMAVHPSWHPLVDLSWWHMGWIHASHMRLLCPDSAPVCCHLSSWSSSHLNWYF